LIINKFLKMIEPSAGTSRAKRGGSEGGGSGERHSLDWRAEGPDSNGYIEFFKKGGKNFANGKVR